MIIALCLCAARAGAQVRLIFVESICDDADIINNNYRMKVRLQPPRLHLPTLLLRCQQAGLAPT